LGLILALLMTACEDIPIEIPWLANDTPTPTQMAGDDAVTPTPDMTQAVETTPEPVTELTLWVPPEMDPNQETEASLLFASQLQLFSELHENLEIKVRVKAASGIGGLLDALTAASAAAPGALPDLIVLTRPDLESAALKELIYPLDGLTTIPDDSDWFNFTNEMALLQGSTFGLPFAVDSLVLLYRPDSISTIPATWEELIEDGIPLAFAAESDEALFQLALYQAEGGAIQDNQRRPMLEVDPLSEVFRLFQAGVSAGVFPVWLDQYQTPDQVWTAFMEGQTDLAVIWLSNYLHELPEDTNVSPLLGMSAGVVSYGTGMSWAVATSVESRQRIAVELAEYLVQPEYLAAWSAAAGYIPARPSALEAWKDSSLRSKVNQITASTYLVPTNDLITTLGPILRDKTRQMLQRISDPAQAAQDAVESLGE
jgi:multiple sugar transport system substrate-binding protein